MTVLGAVLGRRCALRASLRASFFDRRLSESPRSAFLGHLGVAWRFLAPPRAGAGSLAGMVPCWTQDSVYSTPLVGACICPSQPLPSVIPNTMRVRSQAVLGLLRDPHWGILGLSWGPRGDLSGRPGASWAILSRLSTLLDRPGAPLARPWLLCRTCWASSGPSWCPLEAFWAVIGGVLGRHGAVWASLGASLCGRSLS